MTHAIFRRSKAFAALAAMALALLSLSATAPSMARAATSPYCNNQTLSNYNPCVGAARVLYQTYGWGDQHSVCVWYRTGGWGSNGNACSSGPGVGVYSAKTFEYPWEPGINVNASGASVVHGVALQP